MVSLIKSRFTKQKYINNVLLLIFDLYFRPEGGAKDGIRVSKIKTIYLLASKMSKVLKWQNRKMYVEIICQTNNLCHYQIQKSKDRRTSRSITRYQDSLRTLKS